MFKNSEQNKNISRGHFLRSSAVITAGLLLSTKEMFAQTSPVTQMKNAIAKLPVTVKKLRGNLYVLEGAGGNIAVLNGPDGMLMVDCGIALSQKKVAAALRSISTRPVKYLIDTHWHFDHSEGNEWVHRTGATIIAHENTRKNLSRTITMKDWNYTFNPAPKSALPTVVFQKEHTLKFNGTAIEMKYYPPAHTDSDISVYFPDIDVLHVADTWGNPSYPFIDHSSGGKLDGIINACNHNLDVTTDKTIIIPGHGQVGNRSQLLEFRDMMVSVKENVSKLKQAGMSLQETVVAKPTAAFDAKYGNFIVDPATFTMLVYREV